MCDIGYAIWGGCVAVWVGGCVRGVNGGGEYCAAVCAGVVGSRVCQTWGA